MVKTLSENSAGPSTPGERAKVGVRSNGTEAISDEHVEMDSWSVGSGADFFLCRMV